MNGHARRLRTLETAFGPPATPRPNWPLNLNAVSDEDRTRLEELTERVRQTGGYHTFTDTELEEAERILILADAE